MIYITLNETAIKAINNLAKGTKFILRPQTSGAIYSVPTKYYCAASICVLSVITTEGRVYKEATKHQEYDNFFEFMLQYRNLSGIVFTKQNRIEKLEDLITKTSDFKIDNQYCICINSFFPIFTNSKLSNVGYIDAVIYDRIDSPNWLENKKLIHYYHLYGYNSLVQAIIDCYLKRTVNNKQIEKEYVNDLDNMHLYEIYLKVKGETDDRNNNYHSSTRK